MLNAILMSVIMLSITIVKAILISVISVTNRVHYAMLIVIILNAIMMSGVMINVAAPAKMSLKSRTMSSKTIN
jgi:hypothetical protein